MKEVLADTDTFTWKTSDKSKVYQTANIQVKWTLSNPCWFNAVIVGWFWSCFVLLVCLLSIWSGTHAQCSIDPSIQHRRWSLRAPRRWNGRKCRLWAGRKPSSLLRSSAHRRRTGRRTWARFCPRCAGPEPSPLRQSGVSAWSWCWWCALGFLLICQKKQQQQIWARSFK